MTRTGLLVVAFGLAMSAGSGSAQAPAGKGKNAASSVNVITTQAKIEIKDQQGAEIKLKQEEQIAIMFLEAISSLEDDCRDHLQRPCPLDELVKGAKAPDWKIGKLKFDPAKDANYRYAITITGDSWVAKADPLHAGLGGFFYDGSHMIYNSYYNPGAAATADSTRLGENRNRGGFVQNPIDK